MWSARIVCLLCVLVIGIIPPPPHRSRRPISSAGNSCSASPRRSMRRRAIGSWARRVASRSRDSRGSTRGWWRVAPVDRSARRRGPTRRWRASVMPSPTIAITPRAFPTTPATPIPASGVSPRSGHPPPGTIRSATRASSSASSIAGSIIAIAISRTTCGPRRRTGRSQGARPAPTAIRRSARTSAASRWTHTIPVRGTGRRSPGRSARSAITASASRA